jgi:hypothetical protein
VKLTPEPYGRWLHPVSTVDHEEADPRSYAEQTVGTRLVPLPADVLDLLDPDPWEAA